MVGLDFNYDFKTDLVLAGAGGVRLLKQESANKFTDVTAQIKVAGDDLEWRFHGRLGCGHRRSTAISMSCSAQNSGLPTVLQNNGDGSFAEIHPFAGVSGVLGFVWADIDADGDPDPALIDDQGKLHVFANERSGQFKERALPSALPPVRAISVADANSDSVLDLIAVQGGRHGHPTFGQERRPGVGDC